jgi:peptide/nickel transport system ATP-binding protein
MACVITSIRVLRGACEASMTEMPRRPLLDVRNLQTHFFNEDGVTRAVDGVSFTIQPGETLGIVGESGCGKSVTALSILRLLPDRIGRIVGGTVSFDGLDLSTLSESEMRGVRGNDIAMIFQEPMTSLNPVLTIGHQIAEAVRIHRGASKSEARARAREMLELVRIPDAAGRLDDYPHQFSGGMRQRVMIAMALACDPKLLIADEPTTALDVTIQAQVLRLMLELKEKTGAAVILITHDLGVVAETCQRVVVMYAGRKVEEAPVLELFAKPSHPYTRGLLGSIARGKAGSRAKRLQEIPGMVPSLKDSIQGCAFAPRCSYATEQCRREQPALTPVPGSPGHTAACLRLAEVIAS